MPIPGESVSSAVRTQACQTIKRIAHDANELFTRTPLEVVDGAHARPFELLPTRGAVIADFARATRHLTIDAHDNNCFARGVTKATLFNQLMGRGVHAAETSAHAGTAQIKPSAIGKLGLFNGWLFHNATGMRNAESGAVQILDPQVFWGHQPVSASRWAARYGNLPDKFDVRSPHAGSGVEVYQEISPGEWGNVAINRTDGGTWNWIDEGVHTREAAGAYNGLIGSWQIADAYKVGIEPAAARPVRAPGAHRAAGAAAPEVAPGTVLARLEDLGTEVRATGRRLGPEQGFASVGDAVAWRMAHVVLDPKFDRAQPLAGVAALRHHGAVHLYETDSSLRRAGVVHGAEGIDVETNVPAQGYEALDDRLVEVVDGFGVRVAKEALDTRQGMTMGEMVAPSDRTPRAVEVPVRLADMTRAEWRDTQKGSVVPLTTRLKQVSVAAGGAAVATGAGLGGHAAYQALTTD